MKANKLNTQDDLNIWQPATDLMTSLMYILMLVVMLLGLYLIQIPETDEIDPHIGDSFDGGWEDDGSTPTPTPAATWWHGGDWDDGGGGGSWHTPTPTHTVSPTPTTTPTFPPYTGTGGGWGGGDAPGENPDNGFKSAVYVMLIDAETERTIKEADVQFELYTLDGALQILNTYYPERLSFRSFVTTEAGTFYLPEKLLAGTYELHEITEPEGYDAAPNQIFNLADLYDWPDPYVVRVPVYPSRNIIRVQMTDNQTGLPVSGGTFDVISVENVITPDGTLRYRAGETVSTIVCDENGYGQSEEIYLGQYTVRQADIPPYYANLTEDFTVEVSKKSNIEPPINAIACERTKINLLLTDELYPTRGIANVTFTVRSNLAGAEPFEATTDSMGRIVLDQLDKGVAYSIVQSSTVGNYRADPTAHTVNITADGRIGQEPETDLNLTNRVLRVALGVTDEFSSVQVPDISLALYTNDDKLITTWTTTGSSLMLETLDAGSYYLIKDGSTDEHYRFTVHDQARLQTFNVHTTYVMQYIVLGAFALSLIVIGVTIAVILHKRRKNKTT